MSFSREIKADKIADVLGIIAAKCPEVREIIPSSGRTDGFYSAVEALSEFIELLERAIAFDCKSPLFLFARSLLYGSLKQGFLTAFWRIGICGRGYMNSTVPERAGVSLLFVEHMFVQ